MFDFDVRSGDQQLDREERARLAPARPPRDPLSQQIGKLPRRPPLLVEPSLPLAEASALMTNRRVGTALVTSHGVLLGLLKERNVMRVLIEPSGTAGQLPVWRAMAPATETLLETDTVGYAVQKLWSRDSSAMPLVRGDGVPCGVLEIQDIVAWMCGRVGAGPRRRPVAKTV